MVKILTYQDLVAVGADEKKRIEFVFDCIAQHESSELYKTGKMAEEYFRGLNTHIMHLEKFIYDVFGKAVPDIYSPNHKIPCGYYFYCLNQRNRNLLGNGVSFSKPGTIKKLGKNFDKVLCEIVEKAENGSVGFGFWNIDHLEPMGIAKAENSNDPVFVPLYDETSGVLMAGIKYWRIDEYKPLTAILFEIDGMTEMRRGNDGKSEIVEEKRDYRQIRSTAAATGTTTRNAGNYNVLPIFPLWNINRQSELLSTQGIIDAYDLMQSTLVNNVDNANLIYWVLKNCGGMDDLDDEKFIERLKTSHVAHVDGDDGADIEAHTVEAPYEANEAALDRLRAGIFDKFMALDTRSIASGAVTATQIEAAYEPLNSICSKLESHVTEFIETLLEFLSIDDVPTYTPDKIVNQQEMIQTIVSAGSDLPQEYKTKKILEILGDIDKTEKVLAMLTAEDAGRFALEE